MPGVVEAQMVYEAVGIPVPRFLTRDAAGGRDDTLPRDLPS
jgi:hypothetical protein